MKNIILWNYERGTWQYDIFCLMIIAFIFLTPKAWFDRREKLATQTSKLIVKSSELSPDRGPLEKRVKELSGNPDAEIMGLSERADEKGESFYEIDIR